ncbi:GNAT family N-acetyltransferase [Bowmanella sp. JS7-9]|uniref:GNAT family N-acetyltransferase n=1 Tax=Pseudobowmanella zhangzhouensis TaxID=1537679 RepID=A0ABW1XI38_9ALTE|nr:GNAT family N-acetyltransferase [Bowmanella sp. JS7-9]TBX25645.1 GCN5 family acetyltransferase [Bowmanella sp. JS7-9]
MPIRNAVLPDNLKAVYLSAEDLRIAASILYNAYHDDPVFCEIFNSIEDGYEQRLRAAIREELNAFWQAKQPMIGLFDEDRMLAVTCVVTPDDKFGPQRFWHWRLKMLLTAGYLGTRQMMDKEELIKQHMPASRYHMISFIGVHPDHQQHGMGQMLLGAIQALLDADTTSEGVGVYVTLDKYLEFFKGAGYGVVEQLEVAGIAGHLMFKPR